MESREILQITIELGDQETDVIKVHENDEPADLAAEFCKRHGLDAKNLEILTNLIEQNIDLLIESEKKSESSKMQLVEQVIVLPLRNRLASSKLLTQAKQVQETFTKSRRPSSTAPTQKKYVEKDNINRYGIKTPSKVPKITAKQCYDKLDQYFTLFELLNPNSEGKISPESLTVPALPQNMATIINPLINDLKNSHKTIGFSDFAQGMDRILASLEKEEKGGLLEINQKKDYSFATSKPGKMSLYERQMLIRLKNEEKLKEKRILKETEELRECRFQPKVKNIYRPK